MRKKNKTLSKSPKKGKLPYYIIHLDYRSKNNYVAMAAKNKNTHV
jgi:hypothetical protein